MFDVRCSPFPLFRQFLVLLLSLLLFLSTLPLPAALPNTPRPPNIILILADDLGYGDLGCYGQKRVQTPNLDRLAAEGARFTQFYAGGAADAFSRLALLTGRHTGNLLNRDTNAPALTAEDVTVAEILRTAGYQTAMIGTWGIGDHITLNTPIRKGFHDWIGILSAPQMYHYYPERFWRNDREIVLTSALKQQIGAYAPDIYTRGATNFIRVNDDRPFFLLAAYPFIRPNPALKDKGLPVPSDQPYSQQPWPQPEKNKAALITRLDTEVGKLLTVLQKHKIDQHTIVFFTSDNGPHKEAGISPAFFQSAGPLRGIKGDLYEGGLRVPFIARWPNKIPPGKIIAQPRAAWDFLPTAAELSGMKIPKGVNGLSLSSALFDKKSEGHTYLYWTSANGKKAVRFGDWKALQPGPNQPLELYHLKTDPGEQENIALKHPDILAKAQKYLSEAGTQKTGEPTNPSPQSHNSN